MSYLYKTNLSYNELQEVYAKYIGIKSGGLLDDSRWDFPKKVKPLYDELLAKNWDASQVSDELFKEVLPLDVTTGQYDFEYISPASNCYERDSDSFENLVAKKENSKSIFNIFSTSEKDDEDNQCDALTFFAAAVGIAGIINVMST